MQGTITWLDIKDAPDKEWILIWAKPYECAITAIKSHDADKWWYNYSYNVVFENPPTHFAYINEPGSKQPEPLKTLRDQGCPECGCDVEYTQAYCESTQEFWLDGVCTNHACNHQTDLVPATWERKEG